MTGVCVLDTGVPAPGTALAGFSESSPASADGVLLDTLGLSEVFVLSVLISLGEVGFVGVTVPDLATPEFVSFALGSNKTVSLDMGDSTLGVEVFIASVKDVRTRVSADTGALRVVVANPSPGPIILTGDCLLGLKSDPAILTGDCLLGLNSGPDILTGDCLFGVKSCPCILTGDCLLDVKSCPGILTGDCLLGVKSCPDNLTGDCLLGVNSDPAILTGDCLLGVKSCPGTLTGDCLLGVKSCPDNLTGDCLLGVNSDPAILTGDCLLGVKSCPIILTGDCLFGVKLAEGGVRGDPAGLPILALPGLPGALGDFARASFLASLSAACTFLWYIMSLRTFSMRATFFSGLGAEPGKENTVKPVLSNHSKGQYLTVRWNDYRIRTYLICALWVLFKVYVGWTHTQQTKTGHNSTPLSFGSGELKTA